MEAVIAKKSVASVVWKWFVEHAQMIACFLLLAHNVWWWFHMPTVFNTVTYCAVIAFLAGTTPRRWLLWAWLFLMLSVGATHAAIITRAEQPVVTAKPIVIFCGNCEQ